MISDEQVIQLVRNTLYAAGTGLQGNGPLPSTMTRGVMLHALEAQPPGGCDRHMVVFNRYNAIPRHCFGCYKVLVEPRSVIEAFKLMVIFANLYLPEDNTRKICTEGRQQVPGFYKGLIYCRGIDHGRDIENATRAVVHEQIGGGIPVSLKRGCSEFAAVHPDYIQVKPDAPAMPYDTNWQQYEDIVDLEFAGTAVPAPGDSHNQTGFTAQDARIMLSWLIYAATIGDLSYLRVTETPLKPFTNIRRPAPYIPPVD